MRTKLPHLTFIASWGSRRANVSAKLHYSVTKIALHIFFYKLIHDTLDLQGIFNSLRIKTKSTANTNAMRISNNTTLAIKVSEQKICDLSANSTEL